MEPQTVSTGIVRVDSSGVNTAYGADRLRINLMKAYAFVIAIFLLTSLSLPAEKPASKTAAA